MSINKYDITNRKQNFGTSYEQRYFGSTSLPHQPYELIINSTYNNINWDTKNKATLLLPAIEDSKVNHEEYYDKYNDNHNSYSFSYSTHTHDAPFFENLDHLLDNLGTGEFSFEIYYYVIGKKV